MAEGIPTLFVEIAERMGEVFGCPVPKRLLRLGSDTEGWGVDFNTSNEKIGLQPPLTIVVWWNGLPAGTVDLAGGYMPAGDAANIEAFREWLSMALSAHQWNPAKCGSSKSRTARLPCSSAIPMASAVPFALDLDSAAMPPSSASC